MNSKNANNYENVVIRKEQEIGINNFGLEYLVGLEQEIERLNNIIKTYSGYLDNVEYNMKMGNKMVEYELARAVITNAKREFEELKGSDKE